MVPRTSITVGDIMNPKLLYISEGDRPALARLQMLKFGVTAVAVLDEEHRPVGIVSLRDLACGDGEGKDELGPTAPAHTVPVGASIEEGAKALASRDVHHLVVVDRRGVAVGMVSAIDFVRALTGIEPQHPQQFARF